MNATDEIDDDHFTYDGGMRQCISGFGESTKGAVLDLVNDPFNGAKYETVKWHIKELVRWCRELNRENQELKASTHGVHERNEIACPSCGSLTTVDTWCVEKCDECGIAIEYTVKPIHRG